MWDFLSFYCACTRSDFALSDPSVNARLTFARFVFLPGCVCFFLPLLVNFLVAVNFAQFDNRNSSQLPKCSCAADVQGGIPEQVL